MRLNQKSVIVPGAVAVLLILSSCSAAGESSAVDEPVSPLTEYMNAVYGGDLSEEEQQARFEEEDQKREELTAECMAEEGFDYVPNTQGSVHFGGSDDWRPDDRDWVEKYGYGMVTNPMSEDAPPTDEYVDPNADYVASLSANEQQAFYEALFGPPVPDEDMNEDGSYEWNWETSGCSGWAQNEMAQEDPAQSDEFAPLMESMNEFWTEMGTRPEFVEIDAAWVTCMDEAGYPGFAAQADAQNSIIDEQNAYWENNPDGGGDPDSPEMKALQEEEIKLALADLDCRGEVDYRDRYQDAQFAAEAEFIADHKAELDALKAAAAQRSS